jgi:hypothetical protein
MLLMLLMLLEEGWKSALQTATAAGLEQEQEQKREGLERSSTGQYQ